MTGAGTPSIGRALAAGLLSGIASAVLANLVLMTLNRVTGTGYPELTVIPVTLASVVSNLAGGLVYYALARGVRYPVVLFALAALAAAAFDSLIVFLRPPHPGFAAYANPIHFLVALTAILIVPRVSAGTVGAQARPEAPGS
jgi:hypothetical protein